MNALKHWSNTEVKLAVIEKQIAETRRLLEETQAQLNFLLEVQEGLLIKHAKVIKKRKKKKLDPPEAPIELQREPTSKPPRRRRLTRKQKERLANECSS